MNNKNNKGFTLVEVLIAMSVISLIAMAFFTFLNSNIKFNAKNEKDIKALNIAQSEIENLREQIKSGENTEFRTIDNRYINLNSDTVVYQMPLSEDGYKYDVDIDLRSTDNLYTIKISVKLENEYISKKSVELVTQVFGG